MFWESTKWNMVTIRKMYIDQKHKVVAKYTGDGCL